VPGCHRSARGSGSARNARAQVPHSAGSLRMFNFGGFGSGLSRNPPLHAIRSPRRANPL